MLKTDKEELLKVRLKKNFDTGTYTPGASALKLGLWHLTNALLFKSKIIPFSSILVSILKAFGAQIGKDVRIKPGFQVKFPWRLTIGNNSWIAECYIENLSHVKIGDNCCISQNAMLITGNHNYKSENFDLMVQPITLHDGAWVGAGSIVCPGVILATHAILTIGSVATKHLEPYTIYQGNPAVAIRKRI